MHELSITENLLDIALKRSNSKRILKVNLLIGPFSEDREEEIRFYWRDLAKGTPGEGAKLHFEHIKPDLRCLECGGTLNLEANESICVYCQNSRSQLSREDEVKLESICLE